MNPKYQQLIQSLKPNEIDLIMTMRTKYRFGTIEIIVRDGIPDHMLKTVERTNFGKLFPELYPD